MDPVVYSITLVIAINLLIPIVGVVFGWIENYSECVFDIFEYTN